MGKGTFHRQHGILYGKVIDSHDSGLVISCFRSDDSGRQIHDCARFRRSDRGGDNLVESYIGTSRQGDYYLRSCVLVGDRNVDLGSLSRLGA